MVKIITLLLILLIIVLALVSKLKDLGFSKKVPIYFLLFCLLGIFFVSIFTYRFINVNPANGKYSPAVFDGKTLVPGKVEVDK